MMERFLVASSTIQWIIQSAAEVSPKYTSYTIVKHYLDKATIFTYIIWEVFRPHPVLPKWSTVIILLPAAISIVCIVLSFWSQVPFTVIKLFLSLIFPYPVSTARKLQQVLHQPLIYPHTALSLQPNNMLISLSMLHNWLTATCRTVR